MTKKRRVCGPKDPIRYERLADQPPNDVEFHMADDVTIKQMFIAKAGTYIPQHSHSYGHTSMLALGSVRLWKDGVLIGDVHAPTGIFIEAGVKHTFLSLVDTTIVYCIHNVSRTGVIEVEDEHHLI